MALHEQCTGATDEWYTPPHVFDALACHFDLDVSHPETDAPSVVPCDWYFTERGLDRPWFGFVWMNPPFGGRNGLVPWLRKFVEHGDGICLVPDRTSAPWWQQFAPIMDLILFVTPKLKFIGPDGAPGKSPAQGTSLMAIGTRGCAALHRAAGLGFLVAKCSPIAAE